MITVKLAKPSTARAVAAVAAVEIAAAAVIGVGRVIAAVAVAAAIYRLVYSCGSFYSANAHQYAYLLKLKSYAKAAQPSVGGGMEE